MIYPWQEAQWRRATKQFWGDRAPHALLFSGEQGLGKLDFALQLTQWLLCAQKQDSACGSCRSCTWMQQKQHPDVYIVRPQEKSEIIKIEQIREIIADVMQTSQQGGYRIVIIEPAEGMNVASSNALLKTLEEPPAKVLFILISHQLNALLPTIRSRCQTISFTTPSFEMSQDWLLTQDIPKEKIAFLLSMAGNAPLLAKQLYEQGNWLDYLNLLQNFIELPLQNATIAKLVDQCVKLDPQLTLRLFWIIAYQLILKKSNGDEAAVFLDTHPNIENLLHKIKIEKIFFWADELRQALSFTLRKINLNTQLVFENLLIQWHAIAKEEM